MTQVSDRCMDTAARPGSLAYVPTPSRNLTDSTSCGDIEDILQAIPHMSVDTLTVLLSAAARRKTKLVRSELLKILSQRHATTVEARSETVNQMLMMCGRSRHTLLVWLLEAVPSTAVEHIARVITDVCNSRLIDRLLTSDLHDNCKWALVENLMEKYTNEEKNDLLLSLVEKHESTVVKLLRKLHRLPSIRVIVDLIQDGGPLIANACAELLVTILCAAFESCCWCGPTRAQRRACNEQYKSELWPKLAVVTETPLTNFLNALAALERGADLLVELLNSGLFPEGIFGAVAEWILLRTSAPRSSVDFAFKFIDTLRANGSCAHSYLKSLAKKLHPPRFVEAALNWCKTTDDATTFVEMSRQIRNVLVHTNDPSLLELSTGAVSNLALRRWNCDELVPFVSQQSPLAQLTGLAKEQSLACMQGCRSSSRITRSGPLYDELALSASSRATAGESWLLSVPPVVPCMSRDEARAAVSSLIELYGKREAPWFARRCLSAAVVARDGVPPFGLLKTIEIDVEGAPIFVCVRADVPWMSIAGSLLADSRASNPIWWSAVVHGLRYFPVDDVADISRWAALAFNNASPEALLESLASTAVRSSSQNMAEDAAFALNRVYGALKHSDGNGGPEWIGERRKFITLLIEEVAKTASAATLARLFDTAIQLGPSCSNLNCIADAIVTSRKSSLGMRYPALRGTKHRRSRQLLMERLLQWTSNLLLQAIRQVDNSNYISQTSASTVESVLRKVLIRAPLLEMFFEPPRAERLQAVIGLLTGLARNASTVYFSIPPEKHSVRKSIKDLLLDIEERASRVPRNIEGGRHALKVVNELRNATSSALRRILKYESRVRRERQPVRHPKRQRSNDASASPTPAVSLSD
ncbi:hypothetical protein FOZ63_025198 [Perkinsus olseni]|uniref:Uncharacterized protein n=1 Tax=Perkinsus olseni TaxID=32597 RepID=A0A7J6Q211_PEROL|nr:hypothetical protein FOZ63_025198 [Perkinsus olseni]